MLPESSIVNMMFGLTGFSPCSGTSASVCVIVTALTATGCNASVAAKAAAQNLVNACWRTSVIVVLLKRGLARGLLQHRLCVRHGVARTFDAHGDAVVGVA